MVPFLAGHTEAPVALGTTEDAVAVGFEKPLRTND